MSKKKSRRTDATRRSQHACTELKNRIRVHALVWLGHGSKDTAHVCVDTSIKKSTHTIAVPATLKSQMYVAMLALAFR